MKMTIKAIIAAIKAYLTARVFHIKEKTAKVDWSVKDVMVGTVRSEEQLHFNLQNRGYYVPAKFITDAQLPIRYIALYEEDIGDCSGISRFGEVLTVRKLKRRRIPVAMRPNTSPEEIYYYFTLREWIDLPQIIEIQDTSRGKPQFTNKFLLDHCTKSYQLFVISSEEEYRLMKEIQKVFKNTDASASNDSTAVYRINNRHSLLVSDGNFTVLNTDGDVLDQIPIATFAQSPRAGFRRIKKAIE